MQIWTDFELVLTDEKNISIVCLECVNAFVKSPYQLEVKTFFVTQLMHQLSYEHVDAILTSMEHRFGEIEDDGSNSYLLCNLNAI